MSPSTGEGQCFHHRFPKSPWTTTQAKATVRTPDSMPAPGGSQGPSSMEQGCTELCGQLFPENPDSLGQPWRGLYPCPLQAGGRAESTRTGGTVSFQLWGACIQDLRGAHSTSAHGWSSDPPTGHSCPRPLACFAAWAMPAAVSQWSHQPAELMSSNEIRARVARQVLLSVAW